MAYTEKVSLSGTALSFLLYECVNSLNTQEGFLIGDVTSEITNHISDSQSDNARLDTQIVIRTVLPLPSVSLFYLPTGRIKEDILSEILSGTAREIVGWYKYRRNTIIKPTFRDKLISKGLQKYFEKHYSKKTFVTCNLSKKTSADGSTHTFMYRFGKINCFDMYEYIEDVTANLGEKLTSYKKAYRLSPNCVFNKIVKESNIQNNNTSDAILHIHQAVDVRLIEEAKIAAKNELKIRELQAEIKLMTSILSDKQTVELQETYDKMVEDKLKHRKIEMANACVEALRGFQQTQVVDVPNIVMNSNNLVEGEMSPINNSMNNRIPSPVLIPTTSVEPAGLNYAAALKNKPEQVPSTSKASNFTEDLITFDVEEKSAQSPIHLNETVPKSEELKCFDSSPEY